MRRSMRHSWTQRAEAPLHIRLLGSSRLHDEEADLEHLEIPFGTQRVAESSHGRSPDLRIIAQLKRAVASGRGAAAALAEARRTKLTKHHPELSGLVEDVRRIH